MSGAHTTDLAERYHANERHILVQKTYNGALLFDPAGGFRVADQEGLKDNGLKADYGTVIKYRRTPVKLKFDSVEADFYLSALYHSPVPLIRRLTIAARMNALTTSATDATAIDTYMLLTKSFPAFVLDFWDYQPLQAAYLNEQHYFGGLSLIQRTLGQPEEPKGQLSPADHRYEERASKTLLLQPQKAVSSLQSARTCGMCPPRTPASERAATSTAAPRESDRPAPTIFPEGVKMPPGSMPFMMVPAEAFRGLTDTATSPDLVASIANLTDSIRTMSKRLVALEKSNKELCQNVANMQASRQEVPKTATPAKTTPLKRQRQAITSTSPLSPIPKKTKKGGKKLAVSAVVPAPVSQPRVSPPTQEVDEAIEPDVGKRSQRLAGKRAAAAVATRADKKKKPAGKTTKKKQKTAEEERQIVDHILEALLGDQDEEEVDLPLTGMADLADVVAHGGKFKYIVRRIKLGDSATPNLLRGMFGRHLPLNETIKFYKENSPEAKKAAENRQLAPVAFQKLLTQFLAAYEGGEDDDYIKKVRDHFFNEGRTKRKASFLAKNCPEEKHREHYKTIAAQAHDQDTYEIEKPADLDLKLVFQPDVPRPGGAIPDESLPEAAPAEAPLREDELASAQDQTTDRTTSEQGSEDLYTEAEVDANKERLRNEAALEEAAEAGPSGTERKGVEADATEGKEKEGKTRNEPSTSEDEFDEMTSPSKVFSRKGEEETDRED